MSERFLYCSREGLADAMAWAGCSEEEIAEALANFTGNYYDRKMREYITPEEYEKRKNEDH